MTAAADFQSLTEEFTPFACTREGVDREVFYSNDDADRRTAKSICAGCPVRQECLETALSFEVGGARSASWGIWGGVDAVHRKAMVEERRRRLRSRRAVGERNVRRPAVPA